MARVNIFRLYLTLMEKHPVKMQMVTTGLLMAGGDLIAQTQLEDKHSINWNRTRVYALTGCFFLAPVVSRWYLVLERLYGAKQDRATAIKKVLTDQLIFAPLFLPIFITALGLGEHKSMEEIKEEISDTYFDIIIANYKVWPAIQALNFYFVPLNYRLILVQGISLLWNAYISFKLK